MPKALPTARSSGAASAQGAVAPGRLVEYGDGFVVDASGTIIIVSSFGVRLFSPRRFDARPSASSRAHPPSIPPQDDDDEPAKPARPVVSGIRQNTPKQGTTPEQDTAKPVPVRSPHLPYVCTP